MIIGRFSLSRRKPLIEFPGIDPTARDWQQRVIANGGTVTLPTLKAVSDYIRAQKSSGLWSKKLYVHLPCGDQLAAAKVPQLVGAGSSVVTTFNIVEGDFVNTGATGGVKGNGLDKYWNFGWNPVTVGASLSNFTLSSYVRGTELVGTSRTILAVNGPSINLTQLAWAMVGTAEIGSVGAATTSEYAPTVNSAREGYLSVSTNGSRSQQYYVAGVATGTPVSATGAFFNGDFFVLAGNNNGTAGSFSTRYIRAIVISTGLSAAEQLTDYTIMQAFQTALGRQITP